MEPPTRTDVSAGLRLDPLDDARFAPGRIFATRYRIVSLLGRGAMGEVYRADDLRLGQSVALKLMSEAIARRHDGLQRLTDEVRLARGIAHPNVCRVYDIGYADGWHYLSMEGTWTAKRWRRCFAASDNLPAQRDSRWHGSSPPGWVPHTRAACCIGI